VNQLNFRQRFAGGLNILSRLRFSRLFLIILSIWLCIASAPIIGLIYQSWRGSFVHWQNLWQTVLPDALINSVLLLLGSISLAGFLGLSSAWLLARYQIFGRKFFSWALILPLAMPTYIMTFAYLDLWHPLGPLQTFLRWILGYDSPRQFRLTDIRGLLGLVVLMSLTLYPYIFLSVRTALFKASADLEDSAKLLGLNTWQRFYHIELPLIKPALSTGAVLVVLDALNDIAASEFLGVQTLTVLIYNAWISKGDLVAAAQLALTLLLLLFLITGVAYLFKQYPKMTRSKPIQLKKPSVFLHALALCFLITLWVIAFLLPFVYLLYQSFEFFGINWQQNEASFLIQIIQNTFLMAGFSAFGVVLIGFLVIYIAKRYLKYTFNLNLFKIKTSYFKPKNTSMRHFRIWQPFTSQSIKVSLFNLFLAILNAPYALPASILAIGFLIAAQILPSFGVNWQASSVLGLILIYIIRFGRIAHHQIDQGFNHITPSIKESAYLLGLSELRCFYYIQWPLLKPYFWGSILLCFVEMMKELSLTLLIRPIGFETLALWLYDQVSRGQYEQASVFALLIVFLSLIPIIVMLRAQQKTASI
jgi:iron(III) transport system permease protein